MRAWRRNNHKPMAIYTKKGDEGMTSILGCGGAAGSACDDAASNEGRNFGGKTVSKDLPVVCVLGDLDELTSFVGMALTHEDCRHDVREALGKIQNDLHRIGAVVAGSSEASISDEDVLLLEKRIDGLNEGREFDFVKPGAKGEVSARIHVCRAVCRRCERGICKFIGEIKKDAEGEKDPEFAKDPEITKNAPAETFGLKMAIVLRYINRLSDLLFALAEC